MLNRASLRILALANHQATIRNTARMSTALANERHFSVSEKPQNPLGEGKYIKTAAALIIGCVFYARLYIHVSNTT
jgi:hypothetical protein